TTGRCAIRRIGRWTKYGKFAMTSAIAWRRSSPRAGGVRAHAESLKAKGKRQKAKVKFGSSLLPFAFCLLPFAFCLLRGVLLQPGDGERPCLFGRLHVRAVVAGLRAEEPMGRAVEDVRLVGLAELFHLHFSRR